MTYASCIINILEICDFPAISEDDFKCLLFFSDTGELRQTDVYCQMPRMSEKSFKITLEKCINLAIQRQWHESTEFW